MTLQGTIVIVGFMCCGKSEVARSLARNLEVELTDLDKLITEVESRSPGQIISEDGERAFRIIENRVLQKLLETQTSGVISLGGGAWIEQENRDLLSQHNSLSVWLDTPFETCWERIVADKEHRPLAQNEVQAKELFNSRRPVYQLAELHLEVDPSEHFDDLATRIANELSNRQIV